MSERVFDYAFSELKRKTADELQALLGESWVLFGPPSAEAVDEGWSYHTESAYVYTHGTSGRVLAYDDTYEVRLLRKRSAIAPNAIMIGRSPSNDIVIDNSSVSKLHAIIEVANSAVSDAGSRNGTSYNDAPINAGERAFLEDGGLLAIGPLPFYTMSAGEFAALVGR